MKMFPIQISEIFFHRRNLRSVSRDVRSMSWDDRSVSRNTHSVFWNRTFYKLCELFILASETFLLIFKNILS